MVDEDRVLRLLDRIKGDVGALAEHAGLPPDDLVTDPTLLAAIKYRFVTAIQGCARVAHHIAAAEGWPAADSNGDAVRRLARHGILPPDLAARVADAVAFRNLLVHEYAEVDDVRAVRHLDDLDDLRAFVTSVARWLEARPD